MSKNAYSSLSRLSYFTWTMDNSKAIGGLFFPLWEYLILEYVLI